MDVGPDCDDTDGTVSPDATESCLTAADDDCDGVANPVGSADCTDWYLDADGDGTPDATDSPTPTEAPADDEVMEGPAQIDVVIGVDSGPERIVRVRAGADLTLNITNPDEEDEFHLHGYDLSTGETPAGETATITFTADKAGEFEMESHMSGEVLLVIVVE